MEQCSLEWACILTIPVYQSEPRDSIGSSPIGTNIITPISNMGDQLIFKSKKQNELKENGLENEFVCDDEEAFCRDK